MGQPEYLAIALLTWNESLRNESLLRTLLPPRVTFASCTEERSRAADDQVKRPTATATARPTTTTTTTESGWRRSRWHSATRRVVHSALLVRVSPSISLVRVSECKFPVMQRCSVCFPRAAVFTTLCNLARCLESEIRESVHWSAQVLHHVFVLSRFVNTLSFL